MASKAAGGAGGAAPQSREREVRQVALTDKWIKARMKKRPAEREVWSDTTERGLKLRLGEALKGELRSATFIARLRVDGRQAWETLGRYPLLKLSKARKRAKQLSAAALDGVNLAE
ncbi:MAG TPA: Arm DNA-binding domain-containing protein, partial [Stellaceae bacterium]|nr:Arm DNA-binding domain-containing protein [Stellaceae bacterium]